MNKFIDFKFNRSLLNLLLDITRSTLFFLIMPPQDDDKQRHRQDIIYNFNCLRREHMLLGIKLLEELPNDENSIGHQEQYE